MAFQFSTAARNAWLDAIETAIGTAPILRIRSGAAPANCATADSGTVLASITLPPDWLASASGGSKSLSGAWQDPVADAAGTAGHFRIYDSTGTVCHIQGTITATGGGGDMQLGTVTVSVGLVIDVTNFTLTAGGA